MQKLTPSIRFPEFKGSWKHTKLGKVANFYKGKSVSKADIEENGKTRCIRYGELYTYYSEQAEFIKSSTNLSPESLFLSEENDVLIPASGESAIDMATATCVKKKGIALGGDINVIRSDIDGSFLAYYLNNTKKEDIARFAQGISVIHLYAAQLKLLKVDVPPTEDEAKKLGSFFSAIDTKISLLKEKYALLEQYKKGVMQRLFKQDIRFKDENGSDFPDWQILGFSEVFERITRKNKDDNQNVLTISAQMGLVNQEKYFNKSVSAKDLKGYYLLDKGDFAYNKSYSKGYPMGAIKRLNNYDKGVVSTLYICFRVVGDQDPLFWEQFFEAGQLNREINKIAQEGARNHGLLNVSVTEFFSDIEVPVPSRAEQRKIADFLRVLDQKLNAVKEQVDLTQTFKKGLLQQMFV